MGDLLSGDLALFQLIGVPEITLDNVVRVWPGRGGVGIVGRPPDVIHPDPLPAGDTEGVTDEHGVHRWKYSLCFRVGFVGQGVVVSKGVGARRVCPGAWQGRGALHPAGFWR